MIKKTIIELVFVLGSVALLMTLGTWQLQRLEWKESLIQTLQQGYEALDEGHSEYLTSKTLVDLEKQTSPLAVGQIQGRLLRDKAILMGPRIEDGRAGFHLLIPLEITSDHTLLVNAGWVSDLWHDTIEERLAAMPQQMITVQGIIRKPDWNRFSSANSPENNLWFRPDLDEIRAAKDLRSLYPFILYATGTEPPLSTDLVLHKQDWFPRNNHGQYALFWYAMALALIGVYAAFKWSRRKGAAMTNSVSSTIEN